MPWQISILIHGLLSSARDVQNKRIGRHFHDYSLYALFVSFLLVFLNGVAISIVRDQPVFFHAAWQARYYLVIGGSALGLQNYLVFKIYRILPASVVAILSLMNPLAVVLLATLVVGERLTSIQVLGSLILLSSVLILNLKTVKNDKPRRRIYKISLSLGFATALSIAMLFGVGIVNERYLLERLGLSTYLIFGWGSQFFSAIVIVILNRGKLVFPKKISTHFQVWSSALLLAMAGFMFVLTQLNSNSSSLSSLSASFKVVLVVLLSYVILKEKDNLPLKLVCTVFSGLGLYLLLR